MFKRKNLYCIRKTRPNDYVIKQKVINDILWSFKMSDLIKKFVVLRKLKSGDHVGRCPICTPKTLNNKHFRVSDRKGTWKCFECGIGGRTSVGFLKETLDINFNNALLFADQLMNGKKARKYFSQEDIECIPKAKRNEYSGEDLPF